MSEPGQAAVGFRVKSGWATAVLLAGPARSPMALDRRIVALSDPEVPESKQPYHAGFGTLEEDAAEIQRRTKVVRRVAKKSVAGLLRQYDKAGHQIRRAGLAVGSLTEPASIRHPHMRAHALEGFLFRTVLEEALRSHGLECRVVAERSAYYEATAVLRRSEEELKRAVSAFGAKLGGPWRADEKMAALAAWTVLASNPRARH